MSAPRLDTELPSPPEKSWRLIVATALLAMSLLIAGLEWTARQGSQPRPAIGAEDNADFWIATRAKLREHEARQMILLGDSRMQCDVAPEAIAAQLRCEAPLQLAVGGASPVPTLRHIAEESEFSGAVICNVIPYFFFYELHFSGGAQQLFIDRWNAQKLNFLGFAAPLRRARNCLAIRRQIAEARFTRVNRGLAKPASRNRYWDLLADRSVAVYFEQVPNKQDLCAVSAGGVKGCPVPPISESSLSAQFAEYEKWVRRILDRGGQVIFLRLPVSGMVLEAEEEKFPRDEYWRRFAQSSSAQFLDFADVPSLAGFTCPDGSHLDAKDRAPFTRALAKALEKLVRQP